VPLLIAGLQNGAPLVLLLAVHPLVMLIGGVLLLRRSRPHRLGAGVVLGGGLAATSPIVFFASFLLLDRYSNNRSVAAVLLIGFAVMAMAAGLVVVGARGVGDPQLAFRRPRRLVDRLIVALGAAGGIGLFVQAVLFHSALTYSSLSWEGYVFFVFAVPAVLTPLLAVGATPRRFRFGVLLGWVAGGGAQVAFFFAIVTSTDYYVSYGGLDVFAVTLALLLAAAVLDRFSSDHSPLTAEDGVLPSMR
jgi:hypothetical protein